MNFFAASGLINALTSITFGVLVICKNPKGKLNRIFFLMTIALFVWGIGYWKWQTSLNSSEAIFWVRILSLGSLFIPVLFYHWTITLLRHSRREKMLLVFMYTLTLVILPFSFSSVYVKNVGPKIFFDFWPSPGILYSVYLLFLYILPAVYVIYLFFRERYLNSNNYTRGQLMLLDLTILAGFGGGFTNFFLWYDIPIAPYGNILVSMFPFLLGYSMLRHRLFNAKVLATEIVIYFVVLILLVQVALSNSILEFTLRGLFLLLVLPFAYLAIRSSYNEVEQRERIQALHSQLKEMADLKSEFIALATHHISTPLTAIKGYASILNEDNSIESKSAKSAIQSVNQLSNNLVTIVQDFLDVSKIENGGIKLETSNFDLEELIDQAISERMPAIECSNIGIEFIYDPNDTYDIRADRAEIRRAIGNILDNSMRFSKNGTISITLTKNADSYTIEIKDSGMRNLPIMSPRLARKFTRTGSDDEAAVLGNGLGIYVSKQIVEAHGGSFAVEHGNNGWRFCIQFPQKVIDS